MTRRRREALFGDGAEAAARPTTSRELVPVTGCPKCATPLVENGATQGALFRHGGYGANRRTVWRSCPTCGFHVEAETSETNPRR